MSAGLPSLYRLEQEPIEESLKKQKRRPFESDKTILRRNLINAAILTGGLGTAGYFFGRGNPNPSFTEQALPQIAAKGAILTPLIAAVSAGLATPRHDEKKPFVKRYLKNMLRALPGSALLGAGFGSLNVVFNNTELGRLLSQQLQKKSEDRSSLTAPLMLGGALIGAGVTGGPIRHVVDYFRGAREQSHVSNEKSKRRLRNLLLGATAGASLGGLASYALPLRPTTDSVRSLTAKSLEDLAHPVPVIPLVSMSALGAMLATDADYRGELRDSIERKERDPSRRLDRKYSTREYLKRFGLFLPYVFSGALGAGIVANTLKPTMKENTFQTQGSNSR